MSEPAPSRTAQLAAAARAGHLFEHGSRALLTDWLAWPLLGAGADGILAAARAMVGDLGVPVAAWFAARTRVCEDWLAASGADQHVILGAGLESFAWRQDSDVRVFEVDSAAAISKAATACRPSTTSASRWHAAITGRSEGRARGRVDAGVGSLAQAPVPGGAA